MQRGRLNLGGAKLDAAKARKEKFQQATSEWRLEEKLKKVQPLRQEKQELVKKWYDHRIQRALDNNNPEAAAAFDFWKAYWEQESASDSVDQDFRKDFIGWLLGQGKDADHANTPWGRRQEMVQLPDVRAWLGTFVSERYWVEQQVELLKLRTPRTLGQAYLYFKFLVRPGMGSSDAEILQEFDKFMGWRAGMPPFVDPDDAATARPPGFLDERGNIQGDWTQQPGAKRPHEQVLVPPAPKSGPAMASPVIPHTSDVKDLNKTQSPLQSLDSESESDSDVPAEVLVAAPGTPSSGSTSEMDTNSDLFEDSDVDLSSLHAVPAVPFEMSSPADPGTPLGAPLTVRDRELRTDLALSAADRELEHIKQMSMSSDADPEEVRTRASQLAKFIVSSPALTLPQGIKKTALSTDLGDVFEQLKAAASARYPRRNPPRQARKGAQSADID